MLQQRDVDRAADLGHPDPLAKGANRLRRVAPAAEALKRGHPRVVPAADVTVPHQPEQPPLAHHRVREVQPGELDLPRMVDPQRVQEPVIQRAVVLEFQRADRMGDPLDRVPLAVGPVVHRVNTPFIAHVRMRGVQDPVHHRVSHVEVRVGHVDLRPKRARPVGKLAGEHSLEQVEIVFDRPGAIGAVLARGGQGAAVLADRLGVEIANVSLARLDQLHRPLVKLAKIVAGVILAVLPIEPQPADVLLDRVDVLLLFLDGVRVVEPQVALAVVLLGQAEVQANRLRVPDVQIPVRLRRKPSVHPAVPFAGLEIVDNDFLDKIQRGSGSIRRHDRDSVAVSDPNDPNVGCTKYTSSAFHQ